MSVNVYEDNPHWDYGEWTKARKFISNVVGVEVITFDTYGHGG